MKKINAVLKEVLERNKVSEEVVELIESSLKKFLTDFEKKLKKLKINAEVFVGGSYAKETMVKKNNYDIDIFVRFEKRENISDLLEKALKDFPVKRIHGSRDYFQVTITKDVFFEVIPVVKVAKPKDAENITDLSYSHVRYVKKKMKGKILDEIKLAKVFCYANDCYGAESYIKGFSGYVIELLVYHYGSFLKFVRAMANADIEKEKIIIDVEKLHKNKQAIMMDLNSSKLQSPVILIDPTYKQRNVAAALSQETFEKFQKVCKRFLANPSKEFFEHQKPDFEKIRKNAKKKRFELLILEIKTDRQEGDIAGSKLLKFYKHLDREIERFFKIKNQGFDYNEGKMAKVFFVAERKKEILCEGPMINDVHNVRKFKKEHPKAFVKNHKVYAREKINFSLEKFVKDWKAKNNKRMKEMGVVDLRIN